MNLAGVVLAGVSVLGLLQDGDEAASPEGEKKVVVEGKSIGGLEKGVVDEDVTRGSIPDTAQLLRQMPGGSTIDNGPVSGQAQYRGLFGDRVRTLVDGVLHNPACGNWMDAPLHYMPRPQLDSIEVIRGVAPVSLGPETFGGVVLARSKATAFTEEKKYTLRTDFDAGARSVDQGFYEGGMVSAANNSHRLHLNQSYEKGKDRRFGDGTVEGSEYERYGYGVGYGARVFEGHSVSFELRHDQTDETGTPPLPMDIVSHYAHTVSFGYEGEVDDVRIGAKASYTDVEHEMDNFTLRNTPDFDPVVPGPDRRLAETESSGFGWELKGEKPLLEGTLSIGFDGYLAENNTTVLNPDSPGFFLESFHDVNRDLYGAFVEWEGPIAEQWSMSLGLRYTRAEMKAGHANLAASAPAPMQSLAAAFTASDRTQGDNHFDGAFQLKYKPLEELEVALSAGRKTRSPSYIQRFGWAPLKASGGLADGNNYVGDVNLDPEVLHEIDLGVGWEDGTFHFSPRLFYRWVDDFIMGTPVDATPGVIDSTLEMVGNRAGDSSPLRFTNVDAELYGADAEWGVLLMDHLSLGGIASFVRGRRTDEGEDLYRIPPFHGRAGLTYFEETWSVTLETRFAARQDNISRTIVLDEPSTENRETPGYATLNLFGRWSPVKWGTLTAGVENIFDRDYRDHLAGFNQVIGSDVPVGERIPGPGLNFYVGGNISLKF